MPDISLARPIRVQTGSAPTVREVRTLKDASEVLIDWPAGRRGPFYQAAREAVEAAINGRSEADEAFEAFSALCDHAGVLQRSKT